eukprot:INCI3209.1.p1 GENE.INCI3209.1~~INCI3209.1.p1  ORF type:complete len:636 (-),score=88.87 INCI3209.1:976-2883(-)
MATSLSFRWSVLTGTAMYVHRLFCSVRSTNDGTMLLQSRRRKSIIYLPNDNVVLSVQAAPTVARFECVSDHCIIFPTPQSNDAGDRLLRAGNSLRDMMRTPQQRAAQRERDNIQVVQRGTVLTATVVQRGWAQLVGGGWVKLRRAGRRGLQRIVAGPFSPRLRSRKRSSTTSSSSTKPPVTQLFELKNRKSGSKPQNDPGELDGSPAKIVRLARNRTKPIAGHTQISQSRNAASSESTESPMSVTSEPSPSPAALRRTEKEKARFMRHVARQERQKQRRFKHDMRTAGAAVRRGGSLKERKLTLRRRSKKLNICLALHPHFAYVCRSKGMCYRIVSQAEPSWLLVIVVVNCDACFNCRRVRSGSKGSVGDVVVSIDGTLVESLGSAVEIQRMLQDKKFPKTLVLRKPPHVAADVKMLFGNDDATQPGSTLLGGKATTATSEQSADTGPTYTKAELDKVATEAAVHVQVLRTIESHFAAGRISAEDRKTMLNKQREAARMAMAPLNGTPDPTSAKAPRVSEQAAPERPHLPAMQNPQDHAELSSSIHKACQFACETLQAEVISKDMFQRTVDVLLKLQTSNECNEVRPVERVSYWAVSINCVLVGMFACLCMCMHACVACSTLSGHQHPTAACAVA